MALTFSCCCGRLLTVQGEHPGACVTCPACGLAFTVAAPWTPPASAPPPPEEQFVEEEMGDVILVHHDGQQKTTFPHSWSFSSAACFRYDQADPNVKISDQGEQ